MNPDAAPEVRQCLYHTSEEPLADDFGAIAVRNTGDGPNWFIGHPTKSGRWAMPEDDLLIEAGWTPMTPAPVYPDTATTVDPGDPQ